jgi:VWFA-related protein
MKHIKRWRRAEFFILAFAMAMVTVTTVTAQSEQVYIVFDRVETTSFPVVNAYAAIYDQNGVPISGITPDNLTLLENNNEIIDFSIIQEINTRLPLAVSLVIDTSGSMAQGNPTPLSNAISAAEIFINQLQPEDAIGILAISDEISVQQPLTTEKAVAIRALEGLTASGNTSLYDAVYQSVDFLKTSGMKNVIILITDGAESGTSKNSLEEALTVAKEWHIPVYPVGFGYVYETELETIAKETGGFAQISPDSSSLVTNFDVIQDLLRNLYHISYTSNLPNDEKQNQLQITLNYLDNSYSTETNFSPKPLEVNLVSPVDGETLGIEAELLAKPTSVAKISFVKFFLDGQEIDTLSFPSDGADSYKTSLGLENISPGAHQISIVAQDVIGNQNQTDVSVNVREPILINIKNPVDKAQIVTSPMMEIEIDSLRDINTGKIIINNDEWRQFTGNSFNEQWPVHSLKDGDYQILVQVTDVDGRIASESIMITKGEAVPGAIENIQSNVVSTPSSGGGRFLTQDGSSLALFGLVGLFLVILLIFTPIFLKKRRNQKEGSSKDQKFFLREIQGLSPGATWDLNRDEIRLGRKQEENDIPLKGLKASRHMAIIRNSEEGYIIYNQNPQNPILINNMPIVQQALLEIGDKIVMGESVFIVESDDH